MKFGEFDHTLGSPLGSSFDIWTPGLDSPMAAPEDLDSIQESLNFRIRENWEKITSFPGIEIDEAKIHDEIQEILSMDAESLAALEKEVHAKLAAGRKKLSSIYD
jgi:hypothetical protein